MALELRRLSYALGAEVIGIDLSKPLDATTVAEIRAAWLSNHFLLFRGQTLTPAQHVALTANFGRQEPYIFDYQQHHEFPEINVVTNVRGDGFKPELINRGTEWHSDLSFSARPAEASLLYCREVPFVGGDTIFANITMAYERLSPAIQELIDPLYCVHALFGKAYTATPRAHSTQVESMMIKCPAIAQPLVLVHPETGRKALFAAESVCTEIIGLNDFESDALLQMLFRHVERIELTYRHSWRKGDLMMWDNRALLHQEVPDSANREVRLLHRTTTIAPERGAIVPADRTGWDPARMDASRVAKTDPAGRSKCIGAKV